MKQYYIYGLKALRSRKYFYVGLTFHDVNDRLYWHICAAKSGNDSNIKKISVMKNCDYKVRVCILQSDMLPKNKAHELEKIWINKLLSDGHPLTNISTTRKGDSSAVNVMINDVVHKRIKSFCDDRGYKLGAFMESASLKRMLFEIDKG
jgi:hypothetical protein